MNLGRKTAAALLCAVVIFSGAAAAKGEESPGISAVSAVVMDAGSRTLLYSKECEKPMLVASTTKIMTALVVLENCALEETVEILPEYTGIEGSSVYLQAGEKLTVEDLLYCLMLKSGNDAAEALACHTAGSIKAFADMMNEKARELKCRDSFFENPHGLDGENHHSCAYDLALITACAMENPDFCRIVATESTTAAGRHMVNHNKLLKMYEGAVGVKTGYTKAAGRILVSAARRDGHTLIAVTISDPDDWKDHAALLDYGFSLFEERSLCAKGAVAYTLPVIGGTAEQAEILYGSDIKCTLLREESVKSELFLPRFLYGGIKLGKKVGYVVYTLPDGSELRCDLVCGQDIAKPAFEDFWARAAALE